MSGKPNRNQIAELRQAAAMVREMDNLLESLQAKREELDKSAENARRCRDSNAEKVLHLVKVMDCKSEANTGYEGRMLALLTELVDQTAKHARSTP